MGKIGTFESVRRAIEATRRKRKTIVVATNGCFDILHVGHIRNLRDARALGDLLVVGVNSDASVRANKGSGRPIVPAKERAEILASFECVNYVFIFSGRTPFSWIRKLRPDIHVKGGGEDIRNHPDFPAQKRAVEVGGGELILLPHHEGKSTTHIVRKIRSIMISGHPFSKEVVPKVWGYEKWIENNNHYCCKILSLNTGYQCSLHYHKNKDETFLVTRGRVRLELDDETMILTEGDFVRILPGAKHRFAGFEDSLILEASTHHEEEDTYRIEESRKMDDAPEN